MIIKFLKRIFSTRGSERIHAHPSAPQYISAKDQKRAEKAAKTLTQQELEHAQQNKKLTNTEEELRIQVISALYEGIMLDEEYKNHCIESFARSTLSLEDIRIHVENIREFQNMNRNKTIHQQGTTRTTSKLQQKSLPDESYIH